MNYILFDDNATWNNMLPLTFTRPISEIRIGILTIKEKWERLLNTKVSFKTQDYLSEKYTTITSEKNILINSSVIPNSELIAQINSLQLNQMLVSNNIFIAANINLIVLNNLSDKTFSTLEKVECEIKFLKLNYPWDIFSLNGEALELDFALITKGRKSAPISSSNNVLKTENIFIEEGAIVEFSSLNASAGPIYIGKDAEIMEGSLVRGPFALCDHSQLKLGAKIYGATTIGPHCRVGGEVNNSVIFGYSNKAHDGFLGNAVLGEWCNIGADSNNSNLKNNYTDVKMWNYVKEGFIQTKLMFCGLVMGDHSKCGINTMFNTGTVVGVSANIFGAGYPRNFIPSFSWGGAAGLSEFPLTKAYEVAQKVFDRRHVVFDDKEKKILEYVFKRTAVYRRF